MNKRQKIVQERFLDDEEAVIKRLKTVYNKSNSDITDKIKSLDSSIANLQKALADVGEDSIGNLAASYLKNMPHLTPEEAKETLQSMIQSKVYQKNYQNALKTQVDGIMDTMQEKQFSTVSDYLSQCYENGFIGTMYDLQGQGIPLCIPIDQSAMVRAVQLDSKISKGLYSRLGEDVAMLKKKITAQVSRGISSGMSYKQVAQQLAGQTKIGFNNAVRIARTEGHRIQSQATMDAAYKAKEKGADTLKQWDAALDSRTRESHAMVDGEIRELDEPFSNGLMFPCDPNGPAAEVINCRCALTTPARWELDEDELEELQRRAEYFGLDKAEQFEDFKAKYLNAVEAERITKSQDYVVENKAIESREYVDKFGKMTDDPETRREYYKAAKEILNHRSGQNGEDLYLYNTKTKKWCKSTSGKEAERPEYTKEIIETIKKASKGELVAFHNHPYSMPPSFDDINAAKINGYSKGYVLCHNGRIFEYTGSNEIISERLYNLTVAKSKTICYNEFDAQIMAMEQLSSQFGFSFKEVK